MKKSILSLLISTICMSGYAQQAPPNIIDGLDNLFQGHVNQTLGFVPGHVIRVEKPGEWVYENSAGLAVTNPATSMQPAMKFKIASVTKIFTSVAIFKLIQNGQLDFDAPISTYLSLSAVEGFDDYKNIKVKNLLSHTSGIREPQTNFQGRLNYWIFMKRFEDIPLDSLLSWSRGASLGVGNYNYSNTNFYLLAEIIKAVTKDSYQNFITNNIIIPLGLTNTDFNKVPTGSFMRGYLRGSSYADGNVPDGLVPDSVYDFTEASNSWGYGAADIWSNTADLIKFHKALFNGQLLDMNWVDTMKNIHAVSGDMGSYGHGMMQFNSYNSGPVYGYGHTGTAFGYGDMLVYIPSLNIYISSASNYMKIGQEFLQRDIYNFLKDNLSTSIDETSFENSFSIYPNPASHTLHLNTSFQNFQLSVLDITGRLVFSGQDMLKIELPDQPKGLYVLQLHDEKSKKTITKKFILE